MSQAAHQFPEKMASWSALGDLVPLHFVFCDVC